jgi:putative GTP pyrophosphokinase
MGRDELESLYSARFSRVLVPLAQRLRNHLGKLVAEFPRVDQVAARAKAPASFLAKSKKTENGTPKYDDPLHQVQDQVGARITTFYLPDVAKIQSIIEAFFGSIESRRAEPESAQAFDYEGHHYVLFVPEDVLDPGWNPEEVPRFFELQIKTLFQHAWSQAAHDLAYKPHHELTHQQRRLVAFTAAQAWGADMVFKTLAEELGLKAPPH